MTAEGIVGSVASLWRYPVKSMMGEEVESALFMEHGMLGDRAYALVDQETGKVASAKNPRKWPNLLAFGAGFVRQPQASAPLPPVVIALPGGACVISNSPDANGILTRVLEREVKLVCGAPQSPVLEEYWPDLDTLAHRDEVTDEAMPSETFFDCAPVHIVSRATLDRLAELYPQGRFEPKRFRPNILIASSRFDACFMEDAWVGRTIAVGNEVQIKISGNTGRCVMTTVAQDGLPRDLGILKTAALHNQTHVGVYGNVVRPGTVSQADEIRVIE